ncbi:conserved hypothetical protein [Agrobacterium tumefaciens str. Kerr 14]|uniref:Uncharacterized protein n=1 Tax=Agrobacterium tumefaciens str. Kerr 14 TaxID=1183424 RepID=A0A1S7PXV4_AGRTU|nr:conserved hypothetical protein [Agrobacterium tumefaciens str. Kerr 14]
MRELGVAVHVSVRGSPPSVLPDISPTRGEIESWRPLDYLYVTALAGSVPLADLPPCGGDVRQDRGGYFEACAFAG